MQNDSSLVGPNAENDASKIWHISWPHLALGLIGLGLSLYAWRVHLIVAQGGDSGCGVTPTINCDAVLSSKYANIGGIPVGVFGVIYFGIVMLTAVSNEANFSWTRFRLMQLLVSIAGILSSLVFTYISKIILHALCLICLRVHATNAALFLLSLTLYILARKREQET